METQPLIATTIMNIFDDPQVYLEDKELSFVPVNGGLITKKELKEISTRCTGLSKYWDCINKAIRTKQVLGRGSLCIGSLLIYSADDKTNFGYEFNPPYEFHAWLSIDGGKGIVDVALPGVIEKGLTSRDEHGPFLIGREPCILAGPPLGWMEYNAVFHIRGDWETWPFTKWMSSE
jgi:hypothetical protein